VLIAHYDETFRKRNGWEQLEEVRESHQKPPLLVLMGPTATGKTATALALAERYPVEIISVDSALVYRGMDIGTAKPQPQELAQVPHHLIDILDPAQRFSAWDFSRAAHTLIEAIQARGHIPLLAGGTMLYFRALLEGLNDLPQADAAVRAELETQAQAEGWGALHRQLQAIDPTAAARIDANDRQRIQRALEVHRLSGETLTALLRQRTEALQQPLLRIALMPEDRQVLHLRIGKRFEAMMAQGLVDEVKGLRARGDLNLSMPSMRCVGYRQVWQMLDGEISTAEMPEKAVAATRQLAKRQFTWLRRQNLDYQSTADELESKAFFSWLSQQLKSFSV